MKSNREFFSSRWAYLFAALGMAIGAGNLWRFPRLAGQYGGSFLIPWLIFLFLWSIPLIIVEFSVGKKFRLGVIGAFKKGLGNNYTWMGWFVALCTIGIMFYYSVVCGWGLKYFIMSISGVLSSVNPNEFWNNYTTGSWEPVFYATLSLGLGSVVILFGVSSGIERATKILIPALFVLVIIAAIKALSLPNAGQGLNYFFRVRSEDLLNYNVWLEALSQSAWSTGAGWGLVLTYATYVRQKEDIISNSILTGIGNNIASIVIGLAVIPTVFSLSMTQEVAYEALRSGNQGLTFIYMPQLFAKMAGGEYFTAIFFFALFIASISSLIAMLELGVRILMDYKITRKTSVSIIVIVALIAGFPSAYSLKVFNNQDWVWGIGLLLSGFFFIFFVFKFGTKQFVEQILDQKKKSLLFNHGVIKIIFGFMVIEFLVMCAWWFLQSVNWYPDTWWDPFQEFTVGTCLLQWLMIILIGVLFNRKISDIKI